MGPRLPTAPHPGRPSRRAVLLAGVAAVVAGCTGQEPTRDPRSGSGSGTASPSGPAPADPDARLRAAAAADVRGLARRYAAAGRDAPVLTRRLRPLVADLDAHLVALDAAPSRRATPSGGARRSPAAVLAGLARAERAAAERRVADCVRSQDPALARLLAAIAACGKSHVVLLERA